MGKTRVEKRDIYFRRAKEEGWRARSAFKLLQLDEEFDLFSSVTNAVDLCAAPGSWSQVLSRKITDPSARIVAVDLSPMAPIPRVIQHRGDITRDETAQAVIESMGGNLAQLVVCDGAPDVTGVHDLDEYIQSSLISAALSLSSTLLEVGGSFVCKVFRGQDAHRYLMPAVLTHFENVTISKPAASRGSSLEAFIVARGFKGKAAITEADIKFVACGDLSGYEGRTDSDRSYPL